ncbi:MAG: DUF5911 domain-containing protein, partial [Chloroflexota bacterium]|nr:DUF5911 domain-containing protein [Chloroflexota bacterium]
MSSKKETNTHSSRAQHSPSQTYLPIEDHALIGDLHTVVLVGKNGSMDWCCLPRFDSPSVFGAILDAAKGGFFRISPTDMEGVKCQQLYLPETNILLTRFLSVNGVAEITEFMPIKEVGTEEHHHQIIRSVSIVQGSLPFTLTCRPGFNYARDDHHVEVSQKGAIFQSKYFNLGLASPLPLEPDGQGGVQATFTLQPGQAVHFLLESTKESDRAPEPLSEHHYQKAFHDTLNYWRSWLSQCQYQGRWREMVQRSA